MESTSHGARDFTFGGTDPSIEGEAADTVRAVKVN